jgi:uncharacterized protein YebE (UPF0316 family)
MTTSTALHNQLWRDGYSRKRSCGDSLPGGKGGPMLEALPTAALIFVLRCVDVSLGTLRLILTVQGRRTLSSVIGFVEVSVFITAVASVVAGPLDALRILAYGGGFATGTWLGMTIDRHLALGDIVVRAITKYHEPLTKALTSAGFGLTLLEGRGGRGSTVGVIFSVCHRRRLPELLRIIRHVDRAATVDVQDIRQHFHGYLSPKRPAHTAIGPIERVR